MYDRGIITSPKPFAQSVFCFAQRSYRNKRGVMGHISKTKKRVKKVLTKGEWFGILTKLSDSAARDVSRSKNFEKSKKSG